MHVQNPDDEEYTEYHNFFARLLKNAKKDIISGLVLEHDGQQWQDIVSHLEAIKSYAIGHELKAGRVVPHLNRWMLEKRPELLCDLPTWDGEDRIKAIAGYVKLKHQRPEIFEDALKEWGANIFRRLYQDGAQNRCIILKGGQGIGKDHLLRSMFKHLDRYYSKFSSHRDERDCWEQVTSRLVLHIEEFDQTGRLSIPFLKDLITRDWVTYRAPYGTGSITRKCVGSFISSVNIDAVLRDETGNRRFAVFDIESISWEYPKDWSAQILAQFKTLYDAGYQAKSETWAEVQDTNSRYEQVDLTPELLSYWDDKSDEVCRRESRNDLTYAQAAPILEEMARQAKSTVKGMCTLLKVNDRTKRTSKIRLYVSGHRKQPSERSLIISFTKPVTMQVVDSPLES